MTPTETVRLVAVIRQLWPSMKIDSHTPDAWHLTLDDLHIDDALTAVRHLARARTGYIQPADIRRQVAAAAGLLPPTEAEGLTAAAAVAGAQGLGASKLHPAVYQAYRDMGGPTAFDAPPSVIRPQWGRVWAEVVRRHEDELLAGDLGAAVETTRRAAITSAAA
jgi:hypothetical protein